MINTETRRRLIPRHEWLRDRIKHILNVLSDSTDNDDWQEYMSKISNLAYELNWACTEWEKCYKDEENVRQ